MGSHSWNVQFSKTKRLLIRRGLLNEQPNLIGHCKIGDCAHLPCRFFLFPVYVSQIDNGMAEFCKKHGKKFREINLGDEEIREVTKAEYATWLVMNSPV